MALTPGTRLGPYEILSALGAGGMGEVFRARDTRLNREVAIKVLPDSFASDANRVARFTREAQTLASLNHPNIASIHGLEHAGDVRALIMEFVEGEDLSQRLARGAIPIDEALPIARQIADALEAAHEHGIIHRDLKPANIKVRSDGTVKVLDFGLAKAMEPAAGSSPSMSMSPTITTPAMTQAGIVLGTAAYMSPEQARGKPVDKRADIWAYGVVLYEMLTGLRPFEGETISDVLAQVLTKAPDVDRMPAVARRLVAACLEKDPRRRLRDIGDAWRYLEEGPRHAESIVQGSRASTMRRWTWPAVASFLLAALALLGFIHLRETSPDTKLVNTSLLPPDGATYDFTTDNLGLPALSPDGRWIVFGAKASDGRTQLWLRRLDSSLAQPLAGTEQGLLPFWSPDSRSVGFAAAGKLKRIDIAGGPPVPLADLGGSPFRGGSWSQEDVILFSVNRQAASPVQRVSSAGGTASPATTLAPEREAWVHRFPWFLPDGRHFLYSDSAPGQIELSIRVSSLDEPGSPGEVVTEAQSNAMYAQGHLLFLRENTLMAQPFDVPRLVTTGEAVPVAENIPTFTQPARVAGFTVSANGLLVTSPERSRRGRLVWMDRAGTSLGTLGDPIDQLEHIEFSPDRKSLIASSRDQTGNYDLWIYDVARGLPTRFTSDRAPDSASVWSPDGRTIYWRSPRKDGSLFRKASDGTGTDESLYASPTSPTPTSVSPDGKLLLFEQALPGGNTRNDVWLSALTPGPGGRSLQPRPFLQNPSDEGSAQFSPDGEWVAYASNESSRSQVFAIRFPGPGGKRQISSTGGRNPRWRRDGKEIFYLSDDGQLMAAGVTVQNGTLEVGRVVPLFGDIMTMRGYPYDVSANGQTFIVAHAQEDVRATLALTLIQNWTTGLSRR